MPYHIKPKYVTKSEPENEEKSGQPCISHHIQTLTLSNSFGVDQYVLATKYIDADPNDPWCIGLITEVGYDWKGAFIRVDACGDRKWRNVQLITAAEGRLMLKQWSEYR